MVVWPYVWAYGETEHAAVGNLLTSWYPSLPQSYPLPYLQPTPYPIVDFRIRLTTTCIWGLRFETGLVRQGSTFARIPCRLASGHYNY